MKTKTIEVETLKSLSRLLAAKRETAAAASLAAKEAKEAIETLGLPAGETILLRSHDRGIEILADWNSRNVREIPARTDAFFSFKVLKE